MMATWEPYCWNVRSREEYLQKIHEGINLFSETFTSYPSVHTIP